MTIMIMDEDYWRSGVINASSYHPNFPPELTQNRMLSESWRSNYEVGSGWGYFLIEAGVNDRLDFTDSGGIPLTASLNPGVYNANTLSEHIKAQMDYMSALSPGSGDTFTVEIIEMGENYLHWRIMSDDAGGGGFIILRWATGGSTARTVGPSIGFDKSADDTGSLSYVSDYVAIHTEEWVEVELPDPVEIEGACVRLHNLQAGGSIQIWGDNDDSFSAGVKLGITRQEKTLGIWLSSDIAPVRTYSNWRYYIQNPRNTDGYMEMGVNWLSPGWRPKRNYAPGRVIPKFDPSLLLRSTGGQKSSIQLERFSRWDYLIQASDELERFEELHERVGFSKSFFYAQNHESFRETLRYVTMMRMAPRQFAGDFFGFDIQFEEEL